jgi:hypothetical protein
MREGGKGMSSWTVLVWAVLVGCIAGCVSSGIVVLANPKTGQTVECREVADGGFRQRERCIEAYKQAGYTVVGDSR